MLLLAGASQVEQYLAALPRTWGDAILQLARLGDRASRDGLHTSPSRFVRRPCPQIYSVPRLARSAPTRIPTSTLRRHGAVRQRHGMGQPQELSQFT